MELERELADEDVIEEGDEEEFLEHADELDLPEVEDNPDDLKGEATDSELEDYYRELGIEHETDELAPVISKKAKRAKKAAAVTPEKKEEVRKKVLEEMIARTRENPSYSALTRVIKIVKQVFFTGSAKDEEDEQEDKPKKAKGPAVAAILSSGEYQQLLDFFAQELPRLILKACSIGERVPKEGQAPDVKKLYGHLSSKQQMLLKTFSANFNKLFTQILDEGGANAGLLLLSGIAVAQCCLPYGLYRKKLAANCARVVASYSRIEEAA